MTTVLAAIDNSAAARGVLAAAAALALRLNAGVQAVHVRQDGTQTVAGMAEAAHFPFEVVVGDPVEAIVEAGEAPGVVAVVMGVRGATTGRRPAGRTALAVVQRSTKPVLVVPPDWLGLEFGRVILPLDATMETTAAVTEIVRFLCEGATDLIVVHVFGAGTVPAFWDQPVHEEEAWAREFLSRFCDVPAARMRLRRGAVGREILGAVAEEHGGLVVMAWAQDFSAGRAEAVRTALAGSPVPVLLVPVTAVQPRATPAEDAHASPSKADRSGVGTA